MLIQLRQIDRLSIFVRIWSVLVIIIHVFRTMIEKIVSHCDSRNKLVNSTVANIPHRFIPSSLNSVKEEVSVANHSDNAFLIFVH